jgi:two-component system NtrC family sensor kinase
MARDATEVVFCAAADTATREYLEADLIALAEGAFEVEAVDSATALRSRVTAAVGSGTLVPLIVVTGELGDEDGIDALIALNENPDLRPIRKILVAADLAKADLDRALAARAIDGTAALPWGNELRSLVFRLITEFLVDEAPQEVADVAEVVDVDVLSHAFVATERQRREANRRLVRLQRSFLDDRTLSDDAVEDLMIEEIDRALATPPRTTVPAATIIMHAGEAVDGIRVIISGRVLLTREVDGETHEFHASTAGRVIGLNAIALSEHRAFFTVKAVEETTFIRLTLEQLDTALRHSPTLAIHFVTVLLRALARRNQRSIELRIQVDNLARDLEQERDELAAAIDRLNRARARLVETEKLATLGQLAAGVGHELNNPAAAVSRAADFLEEDIEALAAGSPDGEALVAALHGARMRAPISTREERTIRNELAAALGDETLARRLVKIGIEDAAAYRTAFSSLADPAGHLARLERIYRVGTSLRNVDAAAQRIVRLVGSLRAYARPGDVAVEGLDVTEGLDETLLLLGHDLRHVTVETVYADDVPPVEGVPGDLNQVWTNLITNAIQAMDRADPKLEVAVDVTDAGEVRVRITDNGHGIPPADLDRIFEPTFTTRAGRVEFGLGLGLQIVKDIVYRHGGSIEVESVPGQTCFTVLLPAANGEKR